MQEWDEVSEAERRQVVLEAIKYLTAFGAPAGMEDEIIKGIAEEAREIGLTHEEVLLAVNEARKAVASGRVGQLLSDDPIHEEVEDFFQGEEKIVPFEPKLEERRSQQRQAQEVAFDGPETDYLHRTSLASQIAAVSKQESNFKCFLAKALGLAQQSA